MARDKLGYFVGAKGYRPFVCEEEDSDDVKAEDSEVVDGDDMDVDEESTTDSKSPLSLLYKFASDLVCHRWCKCWCRYHDCHNNNASSVRSS